MDLMEVYKDRFGISSDAELDQRIQTTASALRKEAEVGERRKPTVREMAGVTLGMLEAAIRKHSAEWEALTNKLWAEVESSDFWRTNAPNAEPGGLGSIGATLRNSLHFTTNGRVGCLLSAEAEFGVRPSYELPEYPDDDEEDEERTGRFDDEDYNDDSDDASATL